MYASRVAHDQNEKNSSGLTFLPCLIYTSIFHKELLARRSLGPNHRGGTIVHSSPLHVSSFLWLPATRCLCFSWKTLASAFIATEMGSMSTAFPRHAISSTQSHSYSLCCFSWHLSQLSSSFIPFLFISFSGNPHVLDYSGRRQLKVGAELVHFMKSFSQH